MSGRHPPAGWFAIVAGTGAYLGLQLAHTLRNRNRWPFCSYNMFSYRLRARTYQARVRLLTTGGAVIGPTDDLARREHARATQGGEQ